MRLLLTSAGIKNALLAGYDAIEHGTFIDDETLDLLLARNTPVVPALQFEAASIEHGPAFGMPPAVIDGHQETLEGGAPWMARGRPARQPRGVARPAVLRRRQYRRARRPAAFGRDARPPT